MRRNKNLFGIGKEIEKAFQYVKESKVYFYAVCGIFVFGIIFGFLFVDRLGFLDEFLKRLIGQIEGMNWFEIIIFIFKNNLSSAFLGMVLGIIFGIFSVFSGLFNGIVLGYVMAKTLSIMGIWEFWRLLPHGIFELPAVFIALGIGIKSGMFVFGKNRVYELKRRIVGSLRVFVFVIIPLLAVAAIIEGGLIALLR